MKKLLLLGMLLLSTLTSYASMLGAENLNEKLTKHQLKLGLDGVIKVLENKYIFPEKVLLIEKELQHKLATKKFDDISDWYSFIRQVNQVIRQVSGDMYLDIVETTPRFTLENPQNTLNHKEGLEHYNINILSGNVGYVKLKYFYQNSEAVADISRAFEKLSTVDALIIDVRNAEGESLSLAQYVMSYFLEEGTILSEILFEQQNKRELIRADNNHGNDRFKRNFPVYILTSSFTANAGEFLSYTLKHLGKAVVIGEETMGVAYVQQTLEINAHISINMPVAIPIHPKTKSNWAHSGVIPDLHSKANLSLEVAHKKAKDYLAVF